LRDRLRRDKGADLDGVQARNSFSMKAMRFATLTGVSSFCSPSRGPISMMRTVSLI
jgi:hypothetical protein